MRWIWFFYKKKLKYLVKVFLKDMHSFSIREKTEIMIMQILFISKD